jgi:hypothetical protein
VGIFVFTLLGVILFCTQRDYFKNLSGFRIGFNSNGTHGTSLTHIGVIRSKRHPIEIEQSYNWYNNP